MLLFYDDKKELEEERQLKLVLMWRTATTMINVDGGCIHVVNEHW